MYKTSCVLAIIERFVRDYELAKTVFLDGLNMSSIDIYVIDDEFPSVFNAIPP